MVTLVTMGRRVRDLATKRRTLVTHWVRLRSATGHIACSAGACTGVCHALQFHHTFMGSLNSGFLHVHFN